MIPYPPISPDILVLGPLRIKWYGMMYLFGFAIGYFLLRRLCRQNFLRMPAAKVEDFLVALFLGMLIGARGLYMLVYHRPAEGEQWTLLTPFAVWEGGLSFHGALIGMMAAIYIFARIHRLGFWNLADGLALASTPGLFLGRIGNFINAELYGRPTDVPWAMQFPIRDFDGAIMGFTEARHPSQLYEGIGEGLIAFFLLWYLKRFVRRDGLLISFGIMWYAFVRFLIEFVREKDPQLSYYFGWMTMGQILCGVMFLAGAAMLAYNLRQPPPPPYVPEPDPEPDAPAQS